MGQVLVRVGVKHCKQGKGHKHKSLVHRSHDCRFRPLLMKVGGDNNVYHRLELIVKIYYHRWLVLLIGGDDIFFELKRKAQLAAMTRPLAHHRRLSTPGLRLSNNTLFMCDFINLLSHMSTSSSFIQF
jgi:hypothetical protein